MSSGQYMAMHVHCSRNTKRYKCMLYIYSLLKKIKIQILKKLGELSDIINNQQRIGHPRHNILQHCILFIHEQYRQYLEMHDMCLTKQMRQDMSHQILALQVLWSPKLHASEMKAENVTENNFSVLQFALYFNTYRYSNAWRQRHPCTHSD